MYSGGGHTGGGDGIPVRHGVGADVAQSCRGEGRQNVLLQQSPIMGAGAATDRALFESRLAVVPECRGRVAGDVDSFVSFGSPVAVGWRPRRPDHHVCSRPTSTEAGVQQSACVTVTQKPSPQTLFAQSTSMPRYLTKATVA